jgi:hypothetical protein
MIKSPRRLSTTSLATTPSRRTGGRRATVRAPSTGSAWLHRSVLTTLAFVVRPRFVTVGTGGSAAREARPVSSGVELHGDCTAIAGLRPQPAFEG